MFHDSVCLSRSNALAYFTLTCNSRIKILSSQQKHMRLQNNDIIHLIHDDDDKRHACAVHLWWAGQWPGLSSLLLDGSGLRGERVVCHWWKWKKGGCLPLWWGCTCRRLTSCLILRPREREKQQEMCCISEIWS